MIAPGCLVAGRVRNGRKLLCGTSYQLNSNGIQVFGNPMVNVTVPALVVASIEDPADAGDPNMNMVCLLLCGVDMLVFTWACSVEEVTQ